MTADQLLYIVAGVGKTRNGTKQKQKPHPQIYKSHAQAPYSMRIFSCAMAHPQSRQC